MRDLFDRRTKPAAQHFQIVPTILRGGQKRAIGHHCCPGEVVGQPHLGDGAGFFSVELGEIQRGFQQIVLPQQRHLQ